MSTADLSPNVVLKLQILQKKLGADDLEATLDKSLDIANYIADTLHDLSSKLLVERNGNYRLMTNIK